MTKAGFSVRSFLIALALIATVGIALTLAAVAQDPGGGEPASAPDKITVVEEVELLPDPAATDATAYYKFISANTFVPYDGNMTYTYEGNGCVSRTGGEPYSEHTLQLPQGAEIDYVRIYFYDNDATNDARVWLWAFDGMGNSTAVASAGSSGTPGQSSVLSTIFSHIVDNKSEALSLRLDYGGGSNNDLQICGVRVRYHFNITAVNLPVILNQTNP